MRVTQQTIVNQYKTTVTRIGLINASLAEEGSGYRFLLAEEKDNWKLSLSLGEDAGSFLLARSSNISEIAEAVCSDAGVVSCLKSLKEEHAVEMDAARSSADSSKHDPIASQLLAVLATILKQKYEAKYGSEIHFKIVPTTEGGLALLGAQVGDSNYAQFYENDVGTFTAFIVTKIDDVIEHVASAFNVAVKQVPSIDDLNADIGAINTYIRQVTSDPTFNLIHYASQEDGGNWRLSFSSKEPRLLATYPDALKDGDSVCMQLHSKPYAEHAAFIQSEGMADKLIKLFYKE